MPAPGQVPSNPFTVPYDLTQAPLKVTEAEYRRQTMADFRYLCDRIMQLTLNSYLLGPVKGGIIVGNGKHFSVLPPGPDGSILTADSTATLGLSYKTASSGGLNVISDENRRLLEELIVVMGEILGLLGGDTTIVAGFIEG